MTKEARKLSKELRDTTFELGGITLTQVNKARAELATLKAIKRTDWLHESES